MQRWNFDNGLNNSKSSEDDEQYEARNTGENRSGMAPQGGDFGKKLNSKMKKKYPEKNRRGYAEHR